MCDLYAFTRPRRIEQPACQQPHAGIPPDRAAPERGGATSIAARTQGEGPVRLVHPPTTQYLKRRALSSLFPASAAARCPHPSPYRQRSPRQCPCRPPWRCPAAARVVVVRAAAEAAMAATVMGVKVARAKVRRRRRRTPTAVRNGPGGGGEGGERRRALQAWPWRQHQHS